MSGTGGPNESDLPEGDSDGEQVSTEQSFWKAIFGILTKSKPDRTSGSFDAFKKIKSGADNASGAAENLHPDAPDALVAQPTYTNGGNWASEYFIIEDSDTSLLTIFSRQGNGQEPDSVTKRKSDAKEYERKRNGNWRKLGPIK